jgi:hypothetical protein
MNSKVSNTIANGLAIPLLYISTQNCGIPLVSVFEFVAGRWVGKFFWHLQAMKSPREATGR